MLSLFTSTSGAARDCPCHLFPTMASSVAALSKLIILSVTCPRLIQISTPGSRKGTDSPAQPGVIHCPLLVGLLSSPLGNHGMNSSIDAVFDCLRFPDKVKERRPCAFLCNRNLAMLVASCTIRLNPGNKTRKGCKQSILASQRKQGLVYLGIRTRGQECGLAIIN